MAIEWAKQTIPVAGETSSCSSQCADWMQRLLPGWHCDLDEGLSARRRMAYGFYVVDRLLSLAQLDKNTKKPAISMR